MTQDLKPKTISTRDISPHVAHLVLKNLKDISPAWWDEIKIFLNSKNVNDRKFAITEINKIQLKAMPNQLTADDNIAISVNIINYGNKDTASPQFHSKVVPGTIIESDRLGDVEGGGSVASKKRKG